MLNNREQSGSTNYANASYFQSLQMLVALAPWFWRQYFLQGALSALPEDEWLLPPKLQSYCMQWSRHCYNGWLLYWVPGQYSSWEGEKFLDVHFTASISQSHPRACAQHLCHLWQAHPNSQHWNQKRKQ